jgi:hypothetical protein
MISFLTPDRQPNRSAQAIFACDLSEKLSLFNTGPDSESFVAILTENCPTSCGRPPDDEGVFD